jgi:cytochrome c oxidase subunit IV
MPAPAPSTSAIWHNTLPVWAALMALLAATAVGAYLPLGRPNLVLSLSIAAGKAVPVISFLVQLKQPNPLLRPAACAALILMALCSCRPVPTSWHTPHRPGPVR